MKYRGVYYIILIFFACLLGGIGIKSLSRKANNSESKRYFKELRNIHVIDMSGNERGFSEQGFVILVYFNSECDLCQQEASELDKFFANKPDCFGAFISREDPDQIKKFASDHHLDSLPNVAFFKMHPKAFENDLINQYPQFFIYQSGELIEEYSGIITSSGLAEKIQ